MGRDYSEHYRREREMTLKAYAGNGWTFAKRWRNRVGLPRLIAEGLAYTANRVLRDINPQIFRTDPEARALLELAREATAEFYTYLVRRHWAMFEGRKDDAE